jgi:hypothetical protein
MMAARSIKHLKWFAPYRELGYTVTHGGAGHLKCYDPDGRLVTTFSWSPSCRRAQLNAQADLRRHEKRRHEGGTT